MFSGRLAEVPLSSFARLNQLIKDVTPQSFPNGETPVIMTVGEPQDPTPDFIAEIVHRDESYDLWLAFVTDLDGNNIGLMREAPKGLKRG